MESTKNFSRFKRVFSDLKEFYIFVRPHKLLLFISSFLTIIVSSVGLFIPYFTGRGIDFLVVVKNFVVAKKYFYLLLAFFIISGILNYIKVLVFEKFRYLITRDLRDKIFEKLIYASFENGSKLKPGDVSSRISNDITEIEYLLRVFILQILGSLITFLGALVIMFFIDYKLTFVALFSIIISLFVMFLMARKFKWYSKRILDKLGEISNRVQEIISNFKLVKSYLLEKKELSNLKELNENEFMYQMDRAKYLALFSSINQTLIWLGLILIIGVGFYNMSLSEISTGELVSFILYTFKLVIPAVGLAMSFSYLNQGLAGWERAKFLLELEKESEKGEGLKVKKFSGEVVFKNVCFGYDSEDILSGVSFKIKPGEKIGIVGITGSGKSTILNLLMRFYKIKKGNILIDGKNIEDYELFSYRSRITYIPQRSYLFSGKLGENLFDEDKNIEDIIKIFGLEKIGKDKEIKILGEDVSGGEAQRISILRGLLKDGDIFLVDEVTSSLDSITEEKVFKYLKDVIKNKTAIIVAHRLASIKWVDRILVLDGGIIKESGTHEELISKRGIYYHFYILQKLEEGN